MSEYFDENYDDSYDSYDGSDGSYGGGDSYNTLIDNGDGTFTDANGDVVDADGYLIDASYYTGDSRDSGDSGGDYTYDDWTGLGNGLWRFSDGTIYNESGDIVDASGNPIEEVASLTGSDADGEFAIGWKENSDGTWTWTDDSGNMRRFNGDGTEVGVALGDSSDGDDAIELNPVYVTGDAADTGFISKDGNEYATQAEADEADLNYDFINNDSGDGGGSTFTPETKTILGQTFTKQADGSWQDVDGFKYSQQDIDEAEIGRDDSLWEGFEFGVGDDGQGVYTQTDRNGITRTYDAKTGQVLSAYDIDGQSVTGTDNDVQIVRNPDGSLTTTHPDGLVTTTLPDGSKVTQNGPGGSTQTTTAGGVTTQTTPAGVNPNGTLKDTVAATTVTGGGGNDTTKGGGGNDKSKINTAGIAALLALLANKGGNQTPAYNGKNDPGLINMGMTFSRDIDPVTGQVKSQGFAGMAAGGYMNDTITAVNNATAPVTFDMGGQVNGEGEGGYLRGNTDGMADEIPAVIDGEQPAAIAHGEFIVPADVVSHLGNGNSDAGADRLYEMMDKVRIARTGTKEQGKEIDPDDFVPGGDMGDAGQGITALTKGVKRFNTGGSTSTAAQSDLSPWAGAYTTGLLGQANAIGNNMMTVDKTTGLSPYVFNGPRVADLNNTQNNAITAAGGLTTPTDLKTSITGISAAAKNAADSTYTGNTFTTQYTGTGDYTGGTFNSQYTGTGTYEPTKFDSAYTGTGPYTDKTFSSAYKGTDPYTSTSTFDTQYKGTDPYQSKTFDSQYKGTDPYVSKEFTSTYSGVGPYESGKFDNMYTGTDPYAAKDFANTYKGTAPYQAKEFTNTYADNGPYTAAKFDNTYQKADPYTAAQFTGDDFTGAQVSKYMNPYLQMSLDPQIKAAQDQATRQRLADAGRLTAAGAFGGGRQAVMESEGNRNLLDSIAAITGKGYDTAFGAARDQFNTSQAQRLDRQKASEASRQFGASFGQTDSKNFADLGLRAKEAEEASRQYGNTASMTSASNKANFGLRAQEASEASRQYGNTAAMTDSSNLANFGLRAQEASEASRQYGNTSAMTNASNKANFGMRAKEAEEASRQFGTTTALTNANNMANFGMRAQEASEASRQYGNTSAMTNADRAANYGARAQEQSEASRQYGNTSAMTNADRAANYGQQAANAKEQAAQYGNTSAMTNADRAANYTARADEQSELSKQFGSNLALKNADNAASYAQKARDSSEQSKQFGTSTALTNASNAALYGQKAADSAEQSRQFGTSTALTNAGNAALYGQKAADSTEQSAQFAKTYGLDALSKAITGYQAAGNLGIAGNADTRANIDSQLRAGGTERDVAQAKLDANKDKFNEGTRALIDGLKLKKDMLTGLPIGTVTPISPNTATSEQIASIAGMLGISDADVKAMFGIK